MLENKYNFVLVFDVTDGNPNGNPDAGNMPRMDPQTGQGMVSDVCLKRKIRNYVQLKNLGIGNDIFISEKAILNEKISKSFIDLGIDLDEKPSEKNDGDKRKKKGKSQGSEIVRARDKMCEDYFDIRTFGAVLTTGANAGQVRGPVSLGWSRSVDPIIIINNGITRCAITKIEDSEKQGTMGDKFTIPYGMYMCKGEVSAAFANQTGFSETDLNLLWESMLNMFDNDMSANRPDMSVVKLIVFKHNSSLGDCNKKKCFNRINISKNTDFPRSYNDYDIYIDEVLSSKDDVFIELRAVK